MKRVVDILFSAMGLIIACPLLVFIALLVKLTSSGPVFYTQERVTLNERRFQILKFRTMVEDAEKKTGPTWSGQNDTRITPIGKLLRDTHLDEIPQLWNVLVGDMSLVGPRPERPFFVEHFKGEGVPGYASRHLAKAGITGYAQLRCPNPTISGIHQKTQDDLWYIEHWSLLLDITLLLKTVFYFANCCLSIPRKLLQV